ncbi:hypothetical protein D9615_010283 [Tricholomella constricta]|uniref:Uncharacterized protein n=1 Tax=Tricholomella constricta TaxID=117010 RepID=A0A8H5GLM8_9AGAR|nr:hypothetical protein D9615_010283 [Tricholomella constricta]
MTNTSPAKGAKRAVKKKTKNEAARFETLAKMTRVNVEKYNNVVNTLKAYIGNIQRGKAFLAGEIVERKNRGVIVCELGIPTEELAKALDKPPNQYSAMVVEMFISQKCLIDGCKQQVAEGIHAAFCRYWDNMDGDKYAGQYKFDEETKEVSGCPARAPCIIELKKSIQTRGKANAASRKHAEALTIEGLKKLMDWSEHQCPTGRLEGVQNLTAPDLDAGIADDGGQPFEEGKDREQPLSIEQLHLLFNHGFMRAFMSSAFTLWTRCFELLSLTVGDIKQNCEGHAPYYTPHFKVHLETRKGWQNAQGYDGSRTSNTYNIYSQDQPEIDMYTHLPRWLKLYKQLLGRELTSEDKIFPHISTNGTIHPHKEMSYDCFMKLLASFTSGAELEGWFTTHSFRRGGAQYRFIFAPPSYRWSLNIVRWWGGWAEGESVDTLMKYLLDSLQSYENGHGDALHPVPRGYGESFLGERVEAAPVTANEVRELKRSVNDKIDSIDRSVETKLDNLFSRFTSTLAATHLITAGPTSLVERSERSARTLRIASTPYPTYPFSAVSGSTETVPSLNEDDVSQEVPNLSTCHHKRGQRPVPIQGINIPNLKPGAWKQAIDQWEKGDATIGLVALKDWPRAWYTGEMRTFTSSKRRERQLIVLAYNKLGRDDNAFLKEYPQAEKSMKNLLKAIRKDPELATPRRSRNGTPEERDSAESACADG